MFAIRNLFNSSISSYIVLDLIGLVILKCRIKNGTYLPPKVQLNSLSRINSVIEKFFKNGITIFTFKNIYLILA